MIKTEITTNQIIMTIPYEKGFSNRVRNISGKWDGSKWTFDNTPTVKKALENLIKRFFGFNPFSYKTTQATITIKEDAYNGKAPITIAGFILSSARGRDTGATTGEGVVLLDGEIGSGGSWKNWESQIMADSIFVIDEFPVPFNMDSITLNDTCIDDFISIDYEDIVNEPTQRPLIEIEHLESVLESFGIIETTIKGIIDTLLEER